MPSSKTTKRPSLNSAIKTMHRTNGAFTASKVGNTCLIEPHRGSSLTPIGSYSVGPIDYARITLAEVRR